MDPVDIEMKKRINLDFDKNRIAQFPILTFDNLQVDFLKGNKQWSKLNTNKIQTLPNVLDTRNNGENKIN